MALADTKLKNLKAREKVFAESDGGGLFIEVLPSGKKRWGLKYRLADKQQTIRLGDYPAYGLAEARTWRDDCKALVIRGISPMALKRGDPIPEDAVPTVKEMAQAFIRQWCIKTVQKAKVKEAEALVADTVEAFAWRWYAEVAEPGNSNPRNIKRILEKDVIPAIGAKQLSEVTPDDVLAVTDTIKSRGADQMALATRNVMKRLSPYRLLPEQGSTRRDPGSL